MDWIHALWRWIRPPAVNAGESEHYQWRVGISLMMLANTIILGLHVALAMGISPLSDGYMENEEFNQFRVSDLTLKILGIHEQWCKEAEENNRLASVLSAQLVELQREYVSRTGQSFPLPQCTPN